MPQIAVFEHNQDPATDRPKARLKKNLAATALAQGRAKRINSASIQLFPIVIPANVPSRQGAVYESAASDYYPRFFVGGLTRTEHQPAPFSKCKASRVGHQ